MAYFMIDPGEDLNYTFNWASVLGTATISTSAWAIRPTGPTLHGGSNTTTTATIYVSGCSNGVVYQLINTITTSSGSTEQKTVALRCEDL